MSETGWEIMGSGGGDAVQDRLERRYRRLLATLPSTYRTARGEEMLGALMDGAEGRRWPKLGEALSLAALGIKVRSGMRGEGPTKESVTTLTRAVALVGSLLFAFMGVAGAAEIANRWEYYKFAKFAGDMDGHQYGFTKMLVQAALGILWPVVYAALVLGFRRIARILAPVLAVGAATVIDGKYTLLSVLPTLFVVAAIGMSTPRGMTAMRRPSRFFVVFVPLTALGWYLVAFRWDGGGTAAEELLHLSPIAAVGLVAAVIAARKARHSPVWPLALAIVGAIPLGREVETSVVLSLSPLSPRLVILGPVEAMFVLVAGYAVLRQRRVLAAERAGVVPPPV